mgnify:CR=1 FL=1
MLIHMKLYLFPSFREFVSHDALLIHICSSLFLPANGVLYVCNQPSTQHGRVDTWPTTRRTTSFLWPMVGLAHHTGIDTQADTHAGNHTHTNRHTHTHATTQAHTQKQTHTGNHRGTHMQQKRHTEAHTFIFGIGRCPRVPCLPTGRPFLGPAATVTRQHVISRPAFFPSLSFPSFLRRMETPCRFGAKQEQQQQQQQEQEQEQKQLP